MNLYDFSIIDIQGKDCDLSQFRGKKVLIVNTASECGFTNQYASLQELYENTSRENFEIIGIPSNDFGQQEPGSESDIQTFCQKNYGVTFPMMAKMSVKGLGQHPLYEWLCQEVNTTVTWNFQKFLVNENGQVEQTLAPDVLPIDPEIVDWI